MAWLFRRRPVPQDPEPPQGVVLHVGEREIGCLVLREPDADEAGLAAWLAVPVQNPHIRRGDDIRLTAEDLPDGCLLLPGFELGQDEGADTWP